MHDVVHFHGTYRYATRENLEHAISSARAVLATNDTEIDHAVMRCFVTRGTVLTVNLTSRVDEQSESGGRGPTGSAGGEGVRPLSINRYSAAAVFDLLAETAIEGAVEARAGDARIDFFPSGSSGAGRA